MGCVQRCLGVDHRDVFLVEDDVVDGAHNPAHRIRSVEQDQGHSAWQSDECRTLKQSGTHRLRLNLEDEDNSCRRPWPCWSFTTTSEGNAFDVSSLDNTDLGSNEALAHEMKECVKLFNNIDTNVEFVCQDLQALWADSEHGPRVKFTRKDDAVVAGIMDRSQRHVLIQRFRRL